MLFRSIVIVEPLPDLLARARALHEAALGIQPVTRGAARLGRQYLHALSVADGRLERDDLPVELRAAAAMAVSSAKLCKLVCAPNINVESDGQAVGYAYGSGAVGGGGPSGMVRWPRRAGRPPRGGADYGTGTAVQASCCRGAIMRPASQKANESGSGGAIGPSMVLGSKYWRGLTRAGKGHPKVVRSRDRKG